MSAAPTEHPTFYLRLPEDILKWTPQIARRCLAIWDVAPRWNAVNFW